MFLLGSDTKQNLRSPARFWRGFFFVRFFQASFKLGLTGLNIKRPCTLDNRNKPYKLHLTAFSVLSGGLLWFNFLRLLFEIKIF